MPTFAKNTPELFWQSADRFERANARICTEIEFALPRELSLKQNQELVYSFIKNTIDNEQRKLPYSFAIHNDKDNNNPHCHLVFSVRQIDHFERIAEQFFKRANSKNPELGGAKKDREIIQKEFLRNVRRTWREQANQALEKYGHTARIDERSYEEQGIDKVPRARIARVSWQELSQLERENTNLGQEIALVGKEIDVEHRYEDLISQGIGSFSARLAAHSEKDYQKVLKTRVEQREEKPKQSIKQTEKTPESVKKAVSQADFDRFI
ncbi:hypothetical protein CVP05_11730, partial [Conservatibacter flavescens]